MTKLKSLITPAALLAFTFAAAPSFAQERGHAHGGSSHGSSGQSSGPRAQARSEAPRAQPAAPPRAQSRQEAPRAQVTRPAVVPRAAEGRRNDVVVGRAVPRGTYAPGYAPRYSPRYYPYSRVYGPSVYYRPYVFRPRFSIGFGIFAGYPVPYTYSYPYPIEVYGYGAPAGPVTVSPGASAYGGVALEITPPDADVFVDGQYAGKVQDFDGTRQPLTLTPGTHKIEVQAQGYEPMIVDVGIRAGQVIPYRGDLRPY